MDRADAIGLWWADYPVERTREARQVRVVEPPATGWEPPRGFPNLRGAKVLGLDTETKDLELEERGPGAVRGAAQAVGISIATEDASWYFPLRHEYPLQAGMNQDPSKVFAWLADVLAQPVPIVGANLLYDLEVLRAEGVPLPKGELFDVQYAEPLLDEEASTYELDALARKHLGTGKTTPQLYQWCAQSFGGKEDDSQRSNIWRAPPSLVGPYAEADALLPVKILAAQRKLLKEQELTDLFRLECGLIPMLLAMRFRGVRIDEEGANKAAAWLREHVKQAQAKIPEVDVWSSASIARAFDKAGLIYPRTEAGNPSFTKQFLEGENHELAQAVLDVRLYEKAANPFVESYLLGNMHNGRVHCQFNPLRSRDYGTVSGRFSSSLPNLQNIPVRHAVIGPLLRSLFIPEEGCDWLKYDYSQIEFRALAHYAVGRNADLIRQQYIDDQSTDFHEATTGMVRKFTEIELERRPAKNINFGLVYGMGKEKLLRSLGVGQDLGERLYEAYFTAMPFVRTTYKSAERLAKRRGYIRTFLGRRRRFKDEEGTHKALNAVLQGTAADIIKKAMYDIYKSGVMDVIGAPHLTVHDELDWSIPRTREGIEAAMEVENILVNCVKLRVPLMVEVSKGKNWGECG
jgi:DNA polymerase I-like protein with 3'-5' exonuclease and polymerase domains